MTPFVRNCRRIEEWEIATVLAGFLGQPAPTLILEPLGILPNESRQELEEHHSSTARQLEQPISL
jgi:hypothetical protein